MTTALSNSLQALISKAAEQSSAGEVSRLTQRQQGTTPHVVILADASSSMAESAGTRSKIELVREALAQVWPQLAQGCLFAFASTVQALDSPYALLHPNGGTALHLALEAAQRLSPQQTLIISDGRPDSEEAALAAADYLTGHIDVIYCGPGDDTEAITFLQRLARSTGGRYISTPRLAAGRLNLLAPVQRLLLVEGPCVTS